MRHPDLIGHIFGRLTVVAFAGLDSGRNSKWLCRCACGAETVVKRPHLMAGRVQSCGCLHDELIVQRNRANATHGMTSSAEFSVWRSMLARCLNPGDPGYPRYGGRGIAVCDRWRGPNGFASFYADMGPRPAAIRGQRVEYSIDRINNEGNYEPANCRWATVIEQQRNRRTNRRVTYNGETRTVAEWAEITGINKNTLQWRLNHGRTPEQALAPIS